MEESVLLNKISEDIRRYEQSYRVRSYEVDFQGWAQPLTILNYLQDIAAEHACRLGFSVADLRQRNLTWVLHRSHTRIFRYPENGESLKVVTWPSGKERLFALRDFEIRDQEDKVLVLASSSWALLNLKTMRPTRLEGNLPGYPILPRRALDSGLKALPELEKSDIEIPFRVRLADLDINQHVNNSIYAGWAMETIPEEIMRKYIPAEIEIGFLAAAVHGDRILSRIQVLSEGDSPVFLHQLINERDGQEFTRLKTSWRRV